MVDGDVMHDAFFGLGDVKAGIRMIGLVEGESEDFDLLVDDLLKNRPAPTDWEGHESACAIGTHVYEALKAVRQKQE